MIHRHNLPNKNMLLNNFSLLNNWEEKYLYLIELGNYLPDLPAGTRTAEYLVSGCQSKVWIVMRVNNFRKIELFGDSDAAIVKGLIAIIVIVYTNLNLVEIINLDVSHMMKKLELVKYLSFSRSLGIKEIIRQIRNQAKLNLEKFNRKNAF